jgi:hypothetical protein
MPILMDIVHLAAASRTIAHVSSHTVFLNQNMDKAYADLSTSVISVYNKIVTLIFGSAFRDV